MDFTDVGSELEDSPGTAGSLRHKLGLIINSQQLMVVVVLLVVVDCVVVVLELAIDLAIIQLGENLAFVTPVLSYSGLLILGIFLVEIILRVYVMRWSFLSHKMEVFDAAVVLISFVMDLTFGHSHDAAVGLGLLIVLRLWRVTRIISGVVRSVQTRANQKIRQERCRANDLEKSLVKWQAYSAELEQELQKMRAILCEYETDFEVRYISRPGCDSTDKPIAIITGRLRAEGSTVDIIPRGSQRATVESQIQ